MTKKDPKKWIAPPWLCRRALEVQGLSKRQKEKIQFILDTQITLRRVEVERKY